MVAVCFFCTTLDELMPKIVGWIGVAFFSLAFYTIPKAWLSANEPVLIFSAEGIEDRQGGFGLIEWADMEGFEVHNVHGTKMLGVLVRDREQFLQRVSRAKRAAVAANEQLKFPMITLGFTGLTPGIDQAIEFIQSRSQKSMS